ncbi:hypothetical protein [Dyella agri]|uniref:GNAT family N-acetyltransferase n=1 Tax=Dyella agri TaxID=1926869 RepID=A0ABW8KES3_9GAMM
MNGAAASGYRTEVAELPRDRDVVLALWNGNLGDPARHAGKLDWFYQHHPFGEPLLQLLRHDGEVIGSCGVAPRRMLWRGREIRAGLLADMAVDARHRTLGPALMLQESLLAAATDRFDLVYGFPNRKSLPVVKRLGFAVLGEMPRYSRVLRHAGYLQRSLPRWLALPLGGLLDASFALRDRLQTLGAPRLVATWSEQVDPRMEALWQASSHGQGLLGARDTAMLRWRFDQTPLGHTRYLLLSDSADGPLRAWFACEVVGSVLRVCDYWCVRGTAGIDIALVLALVRIAHRGRHASISLEHAASVEQLAGWQRAGFVCRDSQPVVGKWLGGGPAPAAMAQDWYLTAGDEDE